ncbi:MAG: hypothetical protein QG627_398 [Chlamydiota bacterium]|jgi:hypothetical protein|nr:hypothetical protein [Chlamydiota bacterium]
MGSFYGDKGYISEKLEKKLMDRGLQLFTNLRSKIKNQFMSIRDKVLLRKRVIIETVNDQLKKTRIKLFDKENLGLVAC